MAHYVDKTTTDLDRRELSLREYIVEDALPGYITENFPTLVAFLKAYYEFENHQDSPAKLIDDLFKNRDVSQVDANLLSYIEDELLLGQSYFEGFSDKRAAAKYANTLYQSKGIIFTTDTILVCMNAPEQRTENLQI